VPTAKMRMQIEQLLTLREAMISVSFETCEYQCEEIWKSLLNQCLSKTMKRPCRKSEVEYKVETLMDGGKRYFVATVACAVLTSAYRGEAAATKKLAEHSAARAAMLSEYPACCDESFRALQTGAEACPQPIVPLPLPLRDQDEVCRKRKADYDAKGRLNSSMQLMCGRALIKGDIMFDTQPDKVSPHLFRSTVTLTCYQHLRFSGDALESKKLAEQSASAVALAHLEATIEPIEADHKAKKARLNSEKLAALKERNVMRKAEKRADMASGAITPRLALCAGTT